ncbi:MAG: hypothetical protein ICV72_04750 [Aldersonia sp.]|nr:hypothetical protein [Aldersonia sp.]
MGTTGGTITGTTGADVIVGSDFDETIRGGGGNDKICGRAGRDVLEGGFGADTMSGDWDGDTLRGGAGNDRLVANGPFQSGPDVLHGGAGDDRLVGTDDSSAGVTFVSYVESPAAITLTYLNGVGTAAGWGTDTLKNIHIVDGSRFGDYLELPYGDPVICPTVRGGDGNDTLVDVGAGCQPVTLDGGMGDDRLIGGSLEDDFSPGPGDDYIDGKGPLLGADPTLYYGSWGDRVRYGSAPGPVVVDLAAGTATGEGTDTLLGVEAVAGSPYNDVLRGNNVTNTLWGHDGNDALYGRDGDDWLYGRAGSDKLFGNLGDDTLDGGSDSDSPANQLDGGTGWDTCLAGVRLNCEG